MKPKHGKYYTADKTPIIDHTFGCAFPVPIGDIAFQDAFRKAVENIGFTNNRYINHPRVWRFCHTEASLGHHYLNVYQRSGEFDKTLDYFDAPFQNFSYYATIEITKQAPNKFKYELGEAVDCEDKGRECIFLLGTFKSLTEALRSLAKYGNTTMDERIPQRVITM